MTGIRAEAVGMQWEGAGRGEAGLVGTPATGAVQPRPLPDQAQVWCRWHYQIPGAGRGGTGRGIEVIFGTVRF